MGRSVLWLQMAKKSPSTYRAGSWKFLAIGLSFCYSTEASDEVLMNRFQLTRTAFAAALILGALIPGAVIAEDGSEPTIGGLPFLWFLETVTKMPVAEMAEAVEIIPLADPHTLAMETRMGLSAGTLARLEEEHQLPAGVLGRIARVESAGNPRAKAKTSSAAGAYQWLNGSWREATERVYGRSLPLDDRYDPAIAAEVTAAWLGQEWSRVRADAVRAGIDEGLGVYLVHFLGARGAERFIRTYEENSRAPASRVMTKKQMRANASIFYDNRGNVRTLDSVTEVIGKRLAGSSTVVSSGGVHPAKTPVAHPAVNEIALDANQWTFAMFGRRSR